MFTEIWPNGARRESAPASRLDPYHVTVADLKVLPGSCPSCGGHSPRLTIDLPAEVIGGTGSSPAAELGAISGFRRFFGPDVTCSSCELRRLLRELFPPRWAPPVTSPADREIAELRAALASVASPAAAPGPRPKTGLFDQGDVLLTTPGRLAIDRCTRGVSQMDQAGGLAPSQGLAGAFALLERHVARDHGGFNQAGGGDAAAGTRGNPLASVADRNAAAIAEGHGSIRSSYVLKRMETRRCLETKVETKGLAEVVNVYIRTELVELSEGGGLTHATTLIGLASEVQGAS